MVHARRAGGFTLVEVMVTITLLAIAALLLSASLSSSTQVTSLAREQEVAYQAIRAYLERVRQQYPPQNSINMQFYYDDAQTPINFIPASGPENKVLKDPACLITKMVDETGASWGQVTRFPTAGAFAIAVPASNSITAADRTALGLPRDMNADGDATDASSARSTIQFVPVRIELQWTSATGRARGVTSNRQKVVVYAALSPQH